MNPILILKKPPKTSIFNKYKLEMNLYENEFN